MSEFAFLYRGRRYYASPEQRQQHTQKWVAWFKQLGEQGHLKDVGMPVENTGACVAGNKKLITDGPFAEAKDVVGGFSIVLARDLAEATELSKGCPILEVDGAVEVRPVQALSG